ncbi:uncharacterized protein LOC100897709 [Galendromus occidentalis]|uniref:Uncharacterized protein LOC100897709 n=1 Tax=Galendromus occidentalis TaxID=34638 RepID=A0AAJ6QXH1_9ACAR|nr:uncharacterized protein LOC100897709 [Galendromus occidentalis]
MQAQFRLRVTVDNEMHLQIFKRKTLTTGAEKVLQNRGAPFNIHRRDRMDKLNFLSSLWALVYSGTFFILCPCGAGHDRPGEHPLEMWPSDVVVCLFLGVALADRSLIRRRVDQLRVYNSYKHLCRGDTKREPNLIALAGDVCYCDHLCVKFGDCCVDYPGSEAIRNENFTCERLGHGFKFYYSWSSCANDTLKRGCTSSEQRPSSLMHEPVYLNGTLYKNIYCARCSQSEHYIKTHKYKWREKSAWKPAVPPHGEELKKIFKGRSWIYNESSREYHIFFQEQEFRMWLYIEEFDWTNFTDVFNTSLCPPFQTVNFCTDPTTPYADLCAAYTAYVHTVSNGNITVYRNAHCALCSGVPLGNLTVGLPIPPREETTTTIGNFIPVKEIECPLGAVHVMGFCKPILCQLGFEWNGVQCVTETGQAGCFYLTLDVKWVRFVDSNILLWNHKWFSPYTNITDRFGVVTNVKVCTFTPITTAITPTMERISEVCLISSCICLSLQIITYIILPSMRTTRSGKIVILLSLSIVLGHVMFLVKDDTEPGNNVCKAVAVLAHFFYIESFFWMLVMAIDSCRCLAFNVFSRTESHVMLRYAIFAFLGTLSVVSPALALDFLVPSSGFAPMYGEEVCWFGNRGGFMMFFAVPVLIIILANFALFIITAVKVRSVQKKARSLTQQSNFKSEIVRMKLYLRLAVIIGLTWLFGVLTFLVDSGSSEIYTYAFFLLGFVQGVFIFVAFTCKARILRDIRVVIETKSISRSSLYRTSTNLASVPSARTDRSVPLLKPGNNSSA